MAKPSGSRGSGYAEGQSVLTEDQIRAIVLTVREMDDTNPCQTLLEQVLGKLGEFGSIRSLLPVPKELEKPQITVLTRIRGEVARLPDSGLGEDSPAKPRSI